MTENELLDACRQQNRTAQKTLYDRYAKAMYSTAYRILGDFDLAAEATQDGFLQVFRHIGQFEQRSTLGAWIKTIVIRTAISTLRRQKMAFETLHEWQHAEQPDPEPTALEAEYLEKAILQLPNGCRAVFLLAEVEGYTHKEIATLLQISEGTSKSQLWQAKKRLREWLQNPVHKLI